MSKESTFVIFFLEWKFTYEPLNSLEQSHDFEQRFIRTSVNVKKELEETKPPSPLPSPEGRVLISKINKSKIFAFIQLQSRMKLK